MNSAETRFKKAIDSQVNLFTPMPLIHITDAYSFIDILGPSRISPSPCTVFGEDLTYMFYGRPAYQTHHKGTNFLSANFPVAFIFDPDKLNATCMSVYPFDTGAFHAGLYSNFFHSKSAIDHFRLPGSTSSAQKIVAYFYRSNEEYFFGGSRKNVEVPNLNFEIEGVHELSRITANHNDGTFNPDLRSSSIEFIFDREIDLTGCLLGIVVPQVCLDDIHITDAINVINPKHISTYSGIHNIGSASILGILFDKTYEIYRKEGII
ncbi:hypothetical protein [Aurantimonas endophytica]|uniref:Acetoacetate decarboxylase n=1 Tax=Aurantimonas endophytica TaxID=1522175 RepID=A0A7W6HC63_9HYPH|nr:hypothetical protein [Aurantimonas endophytica]MBB4002367.1 hypothetical protein [Aurantimonas endophytica]MCO6402010.1 hypothetical protein [Aurantimonas endophytica]